MDKSLEVGCGNCACGCGGRTSVAKASERSRGVRRGEPRRFIRGHHRRRTDRYAVVQLGYGTPCWMWKLSRNRDGYGVAWGGRGKTLAHRVEYERHVGPIPQGLTLDHLCRERGCVNPEHLEPVTLIENQRRGDGTKLTPDDVRAIRASGEKQRVLAARFEISQGQVSRIQRRRSWCCLL